MFYHVSPLFQFSLEREGKQEYHIKLQNSRKARETCQAYKDNTGKHLWRVVCKYTEETCGPQLHSLQLDFDTNENTYMWIHADKQFDIEAFMASLNQFYTDTIQPHLVPKLTTIICDQLENSSEHFALSLCEYQAKMGKEQTMRFIDTYFRDIQRHPHVNIHR